MELQVYHIASKQLIICSGAVRYLLCQPDGLVDFERLCILTIILLSILVTKYYSTNTFWKNLTLSNRGVSNYFLQLYTSMFRTNWNLLFLHLLCACVINCLTFNNCFTLDKKIYWLKVEICSQQRLNCLKKIRSVEIDSVAYYTRWLYSMTCLCLCI